MIMSRRYKRKGFFTDLSVTSWIILINVVFFIFAIVLLSQSEGVIDYIALKPANILQGKYLWTLITSMFMHGSFFHLFINMFVLFSLGMTIERIMGRKRFFWFYMLSGIFAGIAFVALAGLFGGSSLGENVFGGIYIPAVGASGAIFAIAALFVVILPKARFFIIFLPFFSLPGYIMVPLVLVLTWVASIAAGLPIGNSAHFGGFLFGIAYGFYLRKKYKRKIVMLNRMIR